MEHAQNKAALRRWQNEAPQRELSTNWPVGQTTSSPPRGLGEYRSMPGRSATRPTLIKGGIRTNLGPLAGLFKKR